MFTWHFLSHSAALSLSFVYFGFSSSTCDLEHSYVSSDLTLTKTASDPVHVGGKSLAIIVLVLSIPISSKSSSCLQHLQLSES